MEMPVEVPDDTEVMRRVRAGHGDLVGLLFERHHRPVYGFFINLTHQSPLSEDLTQEVFLRVLRYATSFKEGSAFRPWLYRIARNVLTDHQNRLQPVTHLDEADHVHDPRPNAHCLAEASADQARLGQALARLPLEKRELLLLAKDPDLRAQDLAGIYGCTPLALKVRVHRALNELRNHFFQRQEVTP
jgi:RNA polymerase sigma-70 factor (ECF subfamily)